jgi:hypothetical protein
VTKIITLQEMNMKIIADFTTHAADLTGRPWLCKSIHPKNGHVQWSDGSLFRYWDFTRLVESSTMNEKLRSLFHRNEQGLSRKAEMLAGSAGGCAVHFPRALADEVYEIVHAHFAAALDTLTATPKRIGGGF